jgi:hypothetical protein
MGAASIAWRSSSTCCPWFRFPPAELRHSLRLPGRRSPIWSVALISTVSIWRTMPSRTDVAKTFFGERERVVARRQKRNIVEARLIGGRYCTRHLSARSGLRPPHPAPRLPKESMTEPFISPVFAFWALAKGTHKIAPMARNNAVRFNIFDPFHGRRAIVACANNHKTRTGKWLLASPSICENDSIVCWVRGQLIQRKLDWRIKKD